MQSDVTFAIQRGTPITIDSAAVIASSKPFISSYKRAPIQFKMFTASAVIIFIVATTLLVALYQKRTNVFCKLNKRLDGKTALVTGGTSGMGFEIAKDFARRGARVIIACPVDNEGARARCIIIQDTGNDKVVFKNLDLNSFNSVRAFATDILNSEERLDIMVNNAGVGLPKQAHSIDGLNNVMQINYYGHFLLTLLLLPLLRKTPSRIVNTSSLLHRIGKISIEHMNDVQKWFNLASRTRVYGTSKLCMIHFARELTRRLKNADVTVNCVDPGAVGTGIWFSVGGQSIGYLISLFLKSVFKTSSEGAQTAIQVALDDELDKVSGEFFKNCVKTRAASWSYSDEDDRLVWEDSVKNCKLSEKELEHCLR